MIPVVRNAFGTWCCPWKAPWAAVAWLLLAGCGTQPPVAESVQTPALVAQIRQCLAEQRHEILSSEEVTRELWEQIVAIDGLHRLELTHCSLTALPGLERLLSLQRLRLGDFPANDAAAEQLAALTQLRVLNLPDAQFSDAGLAAITQLPHLELLRFRSPRVTDKGMQAIAAALQLRFLHLIDVPITDEGLKPLCACEGLESLYLDGSQVTDGGIRELLAALPELHFHRDQLHLPGDPLDDGH